MQVRPRAPRIAGRADEAQHVTGIDGPAAFAGFEGARRMNLGFVRGLSATERATTVMHPEFGAVTANDLIVQLTGHGIHHLKQIRSALGPGPKTEA